VIRDTHNVIPVTLAVLLHAILFSALVVVVDFRDRSMPPMPLAIKGTIVTENAVVIPPKVKEEPAPEAEPEPQDKPPPKEDDTEQQRIQAEEAKRREDARIEQERLNRIKQEEETRRQKAAEAERQRKAEAERKKQEEAELERKRAEAEKQRQAEVERQQRENERLQREAEAARQAEIDAESQRLEQMQSDAKAAYMFRIQQRIKSRWAAPPTAKPGIECVVNITQSPGGDVLSVSIGSCNGDSAVRGSIERAVRLASPLPTPDDPSVFDRNIRLIFRPEE
jgi:colicin import membrane protein